MESTHPFSVSFAPCFQAVLCRSQLFFRMFLDKLFQICADRFIMKQKRRCFSPFLLSPSSRRAWIEIKGLVHCRKSRIVALLAEGVDRNDFCRVYFQTKPVSPSSRRAWIEIRHYPGAARQHYVALLAEGVDRNAWRCWKGLGHVLVALLAEGVDRNHLRGLRSDLRPWSPSSRRAWIEIPQMPKR